MLGFLQSAAAIVFVFGVVIFVHELGHFIAAKLMGVYAPRFSIGFGPALWSRKWGETEYVLAAVPLGGYVRMASREDETMAMLEGGNERVPEEPAEVGGSGGLPLERHPTKHRYWDPEGMAPYGPKPVPADRWFESKPLPARLFIMLAGVTMNIVLGFLIFSGIALALGRAITTTRRIGDVRTIPGVSHLSDLHVGDTVLAVDGKSVRTWDDVLDSIDAAAGPAIAIRTQRGDITIVDGPRSSRTRSLLTAYALRPAVPAVIGRLMPGLPAERGGLQVNDSIIAVNGEPVGSWPELVRHIEAAPGQPLTLTVIRHGAPATVSVRPDSTPQRDPVTDQKTVIGRIGAFQRPSEAREQLSLSNGIRAGWQLTWGAAGTVVEILKQLLTGGVSVRELSGPIGIGEASAEAARAGWATLLSLLALISINVAVFNLLPIPILDGGQIVLNVAETVKGRAFSLRTREVLLRFGLAAIALLFVIVMFNDISRLLK